MLPLLVRVDNLQAQTSTHYAFDRSPVRLGRNQLNDLALDAGFVSQWHALVRFDDYSTLYFDLGSTNGTLVNGQRIGKNVPVPVDGNTEVRIGSLRLYLWRAEAPPHLLNAQRTGVFGTTGSGQMYDRTTVEIGLAGGDVSQGVQHARLMTGAIGSLRPLFDQYRASWASLQRMLQHTVTQFPEQGRPLALAAFQREFPQITNEEQFRELATAHRAPLAGSMGTALATQQMLSQFAQYYVPGGKSPSTPQDVERLLGLVAAALEAYSKSFVELRKGHDQFATEMALRSMGEETPLHSAKEAREVLAYLLDWSVDGTPRIQELTAAFADIMIHQVALLNGLMEGVRGLLQKLSPQQIERDVGKGVWPFGGAGTKWKRYVQRHREFVEEERQITSAVFGAEFARAYATVVGEQFDDQQVSRAGRPPRPATVRMPPTNDAPRR
ncbi:MAG: FHA domain-containing protein [Deltaproteobacteria bacterium]|nr:FHA domain-containing protein [Deltaproteobacteria bacterium]